MSKVEEVDRWLYSRCGEIDSVLPADKSLVVREQSQIAKILCFGRGPFALNQNFVKDDVVVVARD